MAEGFRRAGIVFDCVFDKDANAVASYETNLGHRPVQMDVRDLLAMVQKGWGVGQVDLVVADPPCTPWSRSGSRKGLEDPRDMIRETAELIAELRPRAYLIGNVPGLQDETSWDVVQDVIGELAGEGYCVRDYVQLDAANYGVPQHRIRPFWFGHLDGPCIRWPSSTHVDPRLPLLFGDERPWLTCRDALAHLSAEEIGAPIRMRFRDRNHKGSRPDRPARTLTTNTHGDGAVITIDDRHPPSKPDEPGHTILARDRACGGTLLEWPWDRPSTTVTADPRLTPPGHHSGGRFDGANAIKISERAALILQGFPETWHVEGRTKKQRWSQIGQAMPPPLAEAVARAVREQQINTWERDDYERSLPGFGT